MQVQHLVPRVLTAFLSCATLASCQFDAVDSSDDGIGVSQQATTGTGAESIAGQGTPRYDAVAAIKILLPSATPDVTPRDEYRYCSGVLIEEKTVLTAAGCVNDNVEAEDDDEHESDKPFLDPASIEISFGYAFDDAGYSIESVANAGLTLHRYYKPEVGGTNDLVLLRLTESPGITPVVIHQGALTEDDATGTIELVGYGKAEGAAGEIEAFTARNKVDAPITSISDRRIVAGDSTNTSCHADSGGPGFMDFGDGYELVSITVRHPAGNNGCRTNVARQRVDVYADDFLIPFINLYSGPCKQDDVCATDATATACDGFYPDPDCAENACNLNGVCVEDCPTRDWDCDIGTFTGGACTTSGECEENGTCVPAADAADFLFCSSPCDSDSTNTCPDQMACEADTCVFIGPSPGSQGASCAQPGECRSGFCENDACAFECDAADENACSDAENFCLPSLADGTTTVCRTELETGGAGFCRVAPRDRNSARTTFLFCFGFVLLFGVTRRKRRRTKL